MDFHFLYQFRLDRRVSTGLVMFATLGLLSGCGRQHSQIRFVHAFAQTDASHVDALVDGAMVVNDLAFLASSSYQTVNSGNHNIEIRDTGTSTDLVNAPNVNFFSHSQYTIFFTGTPGANNQTINPVNDDNSLPASGQIKLRFFHAAPSGPACPPPDTGLCFDIYVVAPGTDITTVSPTIPHLVYQQVTNYIGSPAASYEIVWTQTDTKTVVIDQTLGFTAGQIRTLVAVDDSGGTGVSNTLLELPDLN